MKYIKGHELTHEEIIKKIEDQTTSISKEFRDGFLFMEKYPHAVTFYGSARSLPESVHSQVAEVLAGKIVKELGYAVITGGGPGIMRAANKGAREARGKSVGISIDLMYEQKSNEFLTDDMRFNYFFSRKVMLSFTSEAYVFFPGGFGTFDELFGVLTLIQNNKSPRVPIILMGRDFWEPLHEFIKVSMYENHSSIAKSDMHLYHISDNIDEVITIIKNSPRSDWWNKVD